MSDLLYGDVIAHAHLEPGMFIEVVKVTSLYGGHLPPVGSICELILYKNSRLAIDCREQRGSVVTGAGIAYRVVRSKTKLRGVAKFLKEKQL